MFHQPIADDEIKISGGAFFSAGKCIDGFLDLT